MEGDEGIWSLPGTLTRSAQQGTTLLDVGWSASKREILDLGTRLESTERVKSSIDDGGRVGQEASAGR